jgi:hypothetical protein
MANIYIGLEEVRSNALQNSLLSRKSIMPTKLCAMALIFFLR